MFLSILHHYVLWHYAEAYGQFFGVWKNLLWYITRLFSLPSLFRTWFSPWKRIVEPRSKKWDLEDFFSSLLINLLSRIIGFIVRTIIIAVGLTALVLGLIGGVLVYAVWTIAPALLVFLLILGATYLI